jgi:hypothetical protein
MGQKLIQLGFTAGDDDTFSVTAPRNASVIPPGVYLLFLVSDGIPSVAEWVALA